MLTEELHVRFPTKVIKTIDRAVDHTGECLDRSDFIRGAVVRRLREIGYWKDEVKVK